MVPGGLLKQREEYAKKAETLQERAALLVRQANDMRQKAGLIHGRLMKR